VPWGIVAGAAVSAIGGAISSGNQASASEDAAADQQQAALAQLSLSGNIFNAQGGLSLPTREIGGLAQSREAYLLGLDPNLDISADSLHRIFKLIRMAVLFLGTVQPEAIPLSPVMVLSALVVKPTVV